MKGYIGPALFLDMSLDKRPLSFTEDQRDPEYSVYLDLGYRTVGLLYLSHRQVAPHLVREITSARNSDIRRTNHSKLTYIPLVLMC